MKNEILEKIRTEALEKRKETDEFNRKVSRIEELEQNPLVQEYSMLLKSIIGNPRYIDLKDTDIYEMAFRLHSSEVVESDTNGLYVYMGTFVTDKVYEKKVDYDDPCALYRKYWNIEVNNFTCIDVALCEEFEKNHVVFYGSSFDAVNLYRAIQSDFLKTSIENTQEKAVKFVLTKYDNNKTTNGN